MPLTKSYLLMRWLQDKTTGVVPSFAASVIELVRGATLPVKYKGTYYMGEILKISSECYILCIELIKPCLPTADRQQLNKDCKAVFKQETTREQLLSAAETISSMYSTTDSKGT